MPAPYVVALDPGHGGSPSSDPTVLWDPGVVAGRLVEKDITLDLGFRLKALLEKERVKVVMTRTTDRYLEISERWNLVHASKARLFVSLHVNAFDGDPSINGLTVFYPRAESQAFAQHLEAGLASALQPFGVPDDGVAPKPELWVGPGGSAPGRASRGRRRRRPRPAVGTGGSGRCRSPAVGDCTARSSAQRARSKAIWPPRPAAPIRGP